MKRETVKFYHCFTLLLIILSLSSGCIEGTSEMYDGKVRETSEIYKSDELSDEESPARENSETEFWLKFNCYYMGQINFFESGGVDLTACSSSLAESMAGKIIRVLNDKGNGNCGRSDIYGVEIGLGFVEATLENLKKADDKYSVLMAKGWQKRIGEGRPVSTGGYLPGVLYIDDRGWFTEEERMRIRVRLSQGIIFLCGSLNEDIVKLNINIYNETKGKRKWLLDIFHGKIKLD